MSHKIILEDGDFGTYTVSEIRKGGKSVLIQTDWEYPSFASMFGWNMRGRKCDHRGTDGTVKCPDCGKTASAFIEEARSYIDRHIGKVVLDRSDFFSYIEGEE